VYEIPDTSSHFVNWYAVSAEIRSEGPEKRALQIGELITEVSVCYYPRMTSPKKSKIPDDKLDLYNKLVKSDPRIERKGAAHPYTSLNGHMFTYLDQAGILGIRLPADELEAFLKKYKTTLFRSYGVVKKDWATVPDSLLKNTRELRKYLGMSYEYAKTLKPK
jgi:hypothetical protein